MEASAYAPPPHPSTHTLVQQITCPERKSNGDLKRGIENHDSTNYFGGGKKGNRYGEIRAGINARGERRAKRKNPYYYVLFGWTETACRSLLTEWRDSSRGAILQRNKTERRPRETNTKV